jgi:hypothetical protein
MNPPSNSAEIVAGLPSGGGTHGDLVGLKRRQKMEVFHKVPGTFGHALTSMKLEVPDTSGEFQPEQRVRTLGTGGQSLFRTQWLATGHVGPQVSTYNGAKAMAGGLSR